MTFLYYLTTKTQLLCSYYNHTDVTNICYCYDILLHTVLCLMLFYMLTNTSELYVWWFIFTLSIQFYQQKGLKLWD